MSSPQRWQRNRHWAALGPRDIGFPIRIRPGRADSTEGVSIHYPLKGGPRIFSRFPDSKMGVI